MIDAVPDARQALIFDRDREPAVLEQARRAVMKPAPNAQNHHKVNIFTRSVSCSAYGTQSRGTIVAPTCRPCGRAGAHRHRFADIRLSHRDDILCAMDTGQFWKLIAGARGRVADPAHSEAVAAQATVLLSAFPPPEIVATESVLRGLMAASYRTLLWAGASLINGGCSDDGFDYFRGWLIVQGREVFERSVADPDSLADVPVIGPPRIGKPPTECEDTLYIVMRAHKMATGQEIPADAFTVRHSELEEAVWDFTDRSELARRLPRLTSLCWPM